MRSVIGPHFFKIALISIVQCNKMRIYALLWYTHCSAHVEFIIMINNISWVWPSACSHFEGNFVWEVASRDFVSVRCSRRLILY